MASIRVILKEDKINVEGEAPLYLRIIKDRKSKFITLGFKIKPEHWDKEKQEVKKANPNSARLNRLILAEKAKAMDIVLDVVNDNRALPSNLKKAMKGEGGNNFIEYANNYIQKMQTSSTHGTYKRYKSVIKKLNDYAGNKITFNDITVQFLKDYEKYLSSELHNETNTIHANFKAIRKIIKEAQNEGIIKYEQNAFNILNLKTKPTEIEFLTDEELSLLENLELVAGSKKDQHRDLYVFAAYAGGIRISDLLQLKWSNFDGERIQLYTTKTGTKVSIKLPDKAKTIIDKFSTANNISTYYIFPFLSNEIKYNKVSLHNAISSATTYTNKDLKDLARLAGIEKKLHFHTSRHTFATRALRKGIRIEYVSKLMGHSDIKTTQVYAKIVNSELDLAMDVFNK